MSSSEPLRHTKNAKSEKCIYSEESLTFSCYYFGTQGLFFFKTEGIFLTPYVSDKKVGFPWS